MDLEILEALALSDDRTTAFSQLLPGSEDLDYYRGLAAQHAGALDDADTILRAWPERHGKTERYNRLRLRQLLCRLAIVDSASGSGMTDPTPSDQVRDWFGVSHWHEAEVAAIDPTRATRLADGAFDGARLLQQGYDYDSNLSQVTDEGLYELLGRELDDTRRRVLLGRIGHTPNPAVVTLIAQDLATRGSGGFGSLAIHHALTLDQLRALGELRSELHAHQHWVAAVVRRMRPVASIDLELDRDARATYLERVWQFVDALPPANNSLKAHVLWHLLDTARRRGLEVDAPRFAAYLQLPRTAPYVPRAMLERVDRAIVAQLGADFRAVTGLPPAGSDDELVRDLLYRQLDRVEHYAKWLDREWLELEIATAKLLQGARDAERATLALGPATAAALRERVEIAWCLHAPTRFAEHELIALDIDVKNVPELVVKVFRVDPIAYYQHHRKEVSTDLDLDGLAASHEELQRFTEPPVRRVRRRIELPSCTRAGTYVIDLIGNGKSSRVVVYKGRLRHVARVGAAGHVVTLVDEAGRPRPEARAWIGDREYVPDERGSIIVPFSTSPSRHAMLLAAGDIATVQQLDLVRETYALDLNLVLDRESVTAGRVATAIARVELRCAGQPASLALLERTSWDVTLTDRAGVPTTKSHPLVLVDDRAAILEWPIGEDTAAIAVSVRGTVKVVSEQREQELVDATAFEVASIHGTVATEALYLAHTAAGWVVSALGKTGEPRAQRPLTLTLVHRWSGMQLNVELATDAHGRVELGELPGATRISATLGGTTQSWELDTATTTAVLHAAAGREILVPLPATRAVFDTLPRLSLVELRGEVPAAHTSATFAPLEGAIAIGGLAPGDYALRGPRCDVRLTVAAEGALVGTSMVTPAEIVELSRAAPAIEALAATDDLVVTLRGATRRTRVHVIATRFVPALVEGVAAGAARPARRGDRTRGALYVSGRELGDEYRYVLERRNANRFPGLLLERPGLLLNPWARRTTTTDVALARGGDEFARMEQREQGPAAAAPMPYEQAYGNAAAFVGYDFLPEVPRVLANLEVGADGTLVIPRAELGRATTVTVIVDDPAGTTTRTVTLGERALEPRDLRLALALDPARHTTQQKRIAPLRTGETLEIADLATAKLHLIDSLERAHAYLLALREDATLREFAFVTRWHALPDRERRERYSKYACHELHLFLYFKDRAFFDAVVRPYLAHKRTKTFLDHYLLDADLARYLEPAELARLNAVERALLARRITADDAVPRMLADQVAIVPPDPTTDTRLIDAVLGASALDGDDTITAAQESAKASTRSRMTTMAPMSAVGGYGGSAGFAPPAPAASPARMARPQPKKKSAKRDDRGEEAKESEELAESGADFDDLELDRAARSDDKPRPMFRAADKTQEYAEHNWWHLTPQQSSASLIAANRLWRDYARHAPHAQAGFLSPSLGLATATFAEAMCALAVTDLPFVAPIHAITPEGPRLTIVLAGNALVGTSQLVDGELVASGPPLVVGQNYVRTDDRYDWSTGEQVDKYIDGPLAVAVVYTCQVVLANPTSSRQRIAALLQIPRGSLPVGGGRPTNTIDVVLEPYGTHGHEYSFYVPAPGTYSHFPVHVSRDGVIVAAAPPRPLEVVAGEVVADPRSWAHISQRGSDAEVAAYLATGNLAATDVSRIAWRLKSRGAFDMIIAALERRRAFDATVWGYALLHRDRARTRAFLRAIGDRLLQAGPIVEAFGIDAEELGAYEHLEYAPLINARAHRLGGKLRILNDGFAAQYRRFLDYVTHRSKPSNEDLLAAAAYLLVQDRHTEVIATLARVDAKTVADRMQHDYLAAYVACLVGELGRARELATRWRELPVDRWRYRFEALLGMLDEVDGTRPAPLVVDSKSRDQQQAELAARQPAFDLHLDRDGVVVRSQHVTGLELRYFEMDIELLFSRQPFVASDVSRFSFIEPGHRERVEGELPAEHRVPWAAALRGKNVVVEAVGAGMRKAKVHYANDLATNLAHQYGQVRVQRASDTTALPATYVKVYARKRGGAVAFYKDGYTDLRGWFDYASVSTTDLDDVERFAILVCSDLAGAAILEAAPPAR